MDNGSKRSRSSSAPRHKNYERSTSSQTSRSYGHPPLQRAQSIKEQAAKFFGVTPAQDPLTAEQTEIVWQRKRFKHLNSQYGVKSERLESLGTTPTRSLAGTDVLAELVNALPPEEGTQPANKEESRIWKAFWTEPKRTGLERRESVIRMAADTISDFVRGIPFRRTHAPSMTKQGGSFSLRSSQILGTSCSFPKTPKPFQEAVTSFIEADRPVVEEPQEDPRPKLKKALHQDSMAIATDTPVSPSRPDRLDLRPSRRPLTKAMTFEPISEPEEEEASIEPCEDINEVFYDQIALYKKPQFTIEGIPGMPVPARVIAELSRMPSPFPVYPETPRFTLIKSYPGRKTQAKRQISSLPIAGSFKQQQVLVKKQLHDETYDERPFFTYWITCVQIFIMILALVRFGFGTTFSKNYFDVTERSGDVLAPSISPVHLVVYEQNNIWIGPSYADLVHMGAKYTPCMRRDRKILEQIEEERRIESEDTGCCISDVGCYQTSNCARQFSKLVKIINDSSYNPPIIRGVCGQDPRFCKHPRSIAPNKWSQNISQWPICQEIYRNAKLPDHMKCEIQGRPCCIQMHGQCRITTKKYCDFVKGYYHENATLCSQVSCLGYVCGMTPFMRRDHPDQFYRFVTPLFIHAGIIPCIVTVWIQFTYMRKFEIMIGWLRLSIIYFISGIGGYIASATFVPYMPQVGPSGAQMGVLGAMIVNVIYNWEFLKNPVVSLVLHLIVAGFLFLLGILPFIDNFGQIFGFVIGSLLAFILIPYMVTDKKLLIIVFSFIGVICILFPLIILFYVVDPENLPDLSWMSCVSLGVPRICDQQSLQLKDWLPI